QAAQRVTGCLPRLEYLSDQGQHRILIEAVAAQVSILPPPQLELARTHCPLHIDAGFDKTLQMLCLQLGVNDVEGLVATFEAVFDERAQHPVLLVHAVEERANVTMLAEIAAGTSHGTVVRYHLL